MLRYALKRTAYSFLIILGVMMLTFALFRVAAGDPAATVLGKNPSPREIEDMRAELGSGKPLLWGRWLRTEFYSSADFSSGRLSFPGVSTPQDAEPAPAGLMLRHGSKLSFARNFKEDGLRVMARVRCDAPLSVEGRGVQPKDGVAEFMVEGLPQSLELSPAGSQCLVSSVEFFRPNPEPFDSQMLSSLKEIVQVKDGFPYLSFFNFGQTLLTREPIRQVLWRGMWPSLMLMLPIFIGELLLGIALAMVSCALRGTWVDKSILLVSVAGMSVSYLALIIFGQWALAYRMNLFPVWGWGGARHLALPVLIGILSGVGGGIRFYRTVFLNEMNKEYLRTAAAKGCSPLSVHFKHLLKNAMIPILTRASTILPFLFTGSLLLESFFGIPGLGYAGINALNNADLQTLKALVIVGAFLFVGINLATDIAYAWADPRIRLDR